MQKFLVVGCGGSGGATLRYMMDQLRADLRVHGIDELPAAWQFIHVDVAPNPDATPGLGTIVDLGGRYLSVSTPGNSYELVAKNVEAMVGAKQSLSSLATWAPRPMEKARGVNVVNGAGQYRAVGRMLTLTRAKEIQAEFERAFKKMQSDPWGDLPLKMPGETFSNTAMVYPVVVGSLAGGSGASMFLDVARILGTVGNLVPGQMGVFLYTADVFNSLDESLRRGIDGNAMGALGELIAAQTQLSTAADNEMLSAIGLPTPAVDDILFKRVFPIGSVVGGSGALFGDGSMESIYRGLGRALAATVGSEKATKQYESHKLQNSSNVNTDRSGLGWGVPADAISWGSFGYASLSLGRDRYGEYAAQRLARGAVDRLLKGHRKVGSNMPDDEQLKDRLSADWPLILRRLNFPEWGGNVNQWLYSDAVLPAQRVRAEAERMVAPVENDVTQIPGDRAEGFIANVLARVNVREHQLRARETAVNAAYAWAEAWASDLETRVKAEFLDAVARVGLPYARKLVERLSEHLNPMVEQLRLAPQLPETPLSIGAAVVARAKELRRTRIDSSHTLFGTVREALLGSATEGVKNEGARMAALVLSSFREDVLDQLAKAAETAQADLEAGLAQRANEAGLAQLETSDFHEWPTEEFVPSRFDQADNEVLLTTSAEFPGQFILDVRDTLLENGHAVASVSVADEHYHRSLQGIVTSIVKGQWETTGAAPGYYPVLRTIRSWRSAALKSSAATGQATPAERPTYELATSTKEVLERARGFRGRPGQPLERFAAQTFAEYLAAAGENEAVRTERLERFLLRCNETLEKAQPLIGVDPAMIPAVHPGASLVYEYSFGDVPLDPASPAAQRFVAQMEQNSTLSPSTPANYSAALRPTSGAKRIAMFGGYPKYLPVVYSSFLGQLKGRWAHPSDTARRDLWEWKQTRPLPASLGMGRAELDLMIQGWFQGRMLGLLMVPSDTRSTDPVQIFDVTSSQWRAFASRQLTPRDQYRSVDDWLPGILEGHTLALINCSSDPALAALAPYRALRAIADDSAAEANLSYGGTSGQHLMNDWMATGTWPSGNPPHVGSLAGLASTDVASRAEGARQWLTAVRTYMVGQYLTGGDGMGNLARYRTRVNTPQELEHLPMFATIADLVVGALDRLEQMVTEAEANASAAAQIFQGGVSHVERPDF